ncbi:MULTISPECIES: transposase [unclassified Streptomyces]|uniref:transposase n=1 Tax=unclassified Streptomyces TaxID=2593676 RepID=UPI00364E48A6
MTSFLPCRPAVGSTDYAISGHTRPGPGTRAGLAYPTRSSSCGRRGRTVTEAARELGISSEFLRGWVKKARAGRSGPISAPGGTQQAPSLPREGGRIGGRPASPARKSSVQPATCCPTPAARSPRSPSWGAGKNAVTSRKRRCSWEGITRVGECWVVRLRWVKLCGDDRRSWPVLRWTWKNSSSPGRC